MEHLSGLTEADITFQRQEQLVFLTEAAEYLSENEDINNQFLEHLEDKIDVLETAIKLDKKYDDIRLSTELRRSYYQYRYNLILENLRDRIALLYTH